MKKFSRSLEVIVLQSVALICFVLEIGDIFNVINVLPSNYIPMLIVLLLALLLSSIANLQRHMTQVGKDVHNYNRENDIAYLSQAHTQVSEHLRELIGDEYFVERFTSLQTILKDQMVSFEDGMQFRYHYATTLKRYSSETFLCLTNINTYSLWLDPQIKAANERFIKDGGTIEQFFFFEHAGELDSNTVKEFFLSQEAIHIKMFVVSTSLITHRKIRDNVCRSLIVGTRTMVAWEIFADKHGNIRSSTLIMNPAQIGEYRRLANVARRYKHCLPPSDHIA